MPEIAKAYQDFEEVISGMYQRVEKNGSRFLIVLFPLHIQVAPVYWNRLTKYYSLDATKFDLTYPNQRIGAFCREKQIAYLDATDAFRQHYQQSLSPLFMPRGDAHYNASGQAVVSQLIETYILQQRR